MSSDVEAEAEAVGSRLFQRKRKGSFQIFASLPEVEAVFGLTRDYYANSAMIAILMAE